MLKRFLKYQSLGNDFILFDWFKKPATFVARTLDEQEWGTFIKTICDRHFGVGADGVLVLKSSVAGIAEMLIFNADGSRAGMCLNGLRCVAHHLFVHHNLPKTFKIQIGDRQAECFIAVPDRNESLEVTTTIAAGTSFDAITIKIVQNTFDGSSIDVGNPHFIVFKQVELDWLRQYGNMIESHEVFASKTNVEFVWQSRIDVNKKIYHMNVYERGSGITLACSSGVAALTSLLFLRKEIVQEEIIHIVMPGGSIDSWVTHDGQVALKSSARLVFLGEFENRE